MHVEILILIYSLAPNSTDEAPISIHLYSYNYILCHTNKNTDVSNWTKTELEEYCFHMINSYDSKHNTINHLSLFLISCILSFHAIISFLCNNLFVCLIVCFIQAKKLPLDHDAELEAGEVSEEDSADELDDDFKVRIISFLIL